MARVIPCREIVAEVIPSRGISYLRGPEITIRSQSPVARIFIRDPVEITPIRYCAGLIPIPDLHGSLLIPGCYVMCLQ